MSKKLDNNQLCPRCNKGRIRTTDADQTCSWCGRVFYQSPATVPFQELAVGERFYSSYRPDDLLIKTSDCHPRDGDNCTYADGRPGGNCGPLAPCIREKNRSMRMTGFSYN